MADHQVRVMTWNIWWRFGPGGVSVSQASSRSVGFTPDAVARQEVWATAGTTQADELADTLGLHATFAALLPSDTGFAGHAGPVRSRAWPGFAQPVADCASRGHRQCRLVIARGTPSCSRPR
jgi:hypothetical protein